MPGPRVLCWDLGHSLLMIYLVVLEISWALSVIFVSFDCLETLIRASILLSLTLRSLLGFLFGPRVEFPWAHTSAMFLVDLIRRSRLAIALLF